MDMMIGSCGGSQEPGKGIPVAPLANLPPEVHSRRGRRSHPYGAGPLRRVWYGAHDGIGWVPNAAAFRPVGRVTA